MNGIGDIDSNHRQNCPNKRFNRFHRFGRRDYSVHFSKITIEETDRLTRSQTKIDANNARKDFSPNQKQTQLLLEVENVQNKNAVQCEKTKIMNSDANFQEYDPESSNLGAKDVLLATSTNCLDTPPLSDSNSNMNTLKNDDELDFNPKRDLDQMLEASIDPDKYLSLLAPHSISFLDNTQVAETKTDEEEVWDLTKTLEEGSEIFPMYLSSLDQFIKIYNQSKTMSTLENFSNTSSKMPNEILQNETEDKNNYGSSKNVNQVQSNDVNSTGITVFPQKVKNTCSEGCSKCFSKQTVICLPVKEQYSTSSLSKNSSNFHNQYAQNLNHENVTPILNYPSCSQQTNTPNITQDFKQYTHFPPIISEPTSSFNFPQYRGAEQLWDFSADDFPKPLLISGGSIEKVSTPESKNLLSDPEISPIFSGIGTSRLRDFEEEPRYKIELVDTPPPLIDFTLPKPAENFRKPSMPIPSFLSEISQTPKMINESSKEKPKRNRRTRAEMELYREEVARRKQNEKKTDMERFLPFFNPNYQDANVNRENKNLFLTYNQGRQDIGEGPVLQPNQSFPSCAKQGQLNFYATGSANIVNDKITNQDRQIYPPWTPEYMKSESVHQDLYFSHNFQPQQILGSTQSLPVLSVLQEQSKPIEKNHLNEEMFYQQKHLPGFEQLNYIKDPQQNPQNFAQYPVQLARNPQNPPTMNTHHNVNYFENSKMRF